MDDIAARLDRVESTLAIQQLPICYALAVDGRDVQAWADLFVEDVNCGRHGTGREVLKGIITPALTRFYRSMHQICGHRVDFADADHATGQVYCRAEHESGPDWVVMAICYFDQYERRGGRWFFTRRKERHWYSADQTRRPSGPDWHDWPDRPFSPAHMPGAFETWRDFWDGPGAEMEGKVTAWPVKE